MFKNNLNPDNKRFNNKFPKNQNILKAIILSLLASIIAKPNNPRSTPSDKSVEGGLSRDRESEKS